MKIRATRSTGGFLMRIAVSAAAIVFAVAATTDGQLVFEKRESQTAKLRVFATDISSDRTYLDAAKETVARLRQLDPRGTYTLSSNAFKFTVARETENSQVILGETIVAEPDVPDKHFDSIPRIQDAHHENNVTYILFWHPPIVGKRGPYFSAVAIAPDPQGKLLKWKQLSSRFIGPGSLKTNGGLLQGFSGSVQAGDFAATVLTDDGQRTNRLKWETNRWVESSGTKPPEN